MNELMSLSEYVGQERIKKAISVAITSSLIRGAPFPHTLMSGPPGLGKTTLARIIAEETKCPFFGYLATNIDGEKQIEAIFSKLDKGGYNLKTGEVENRDIIVPAVIFIDEIHNLKRKTMEMLHTLLENNTITLRRRNYVTGVIEPTVCWVPEFCMIGATNYLGSLPKPFRDRFQINLSFEVYESGEIKTLVRNFSEKKGIKISQSAVDEIAFKSRGVPRAAISFFNKAYDVSVAKKNAESKSVSKEDVKYMFECEEIDDMGLNRLDRKALSYLASVPRPIGLKAFAQAIDEDPETVENVIEPYLVRVGFIVRTGSGRYLTDEGKAHIKKERRLTLYPVER